MAKPRNPNLIQILPYDNLTSNRPSNPESMYLDRSSGAGLQLNDDPKSTYNKNTQEELGSGTMGDERRKMEGESAESSGAGSSTPGFNLFSRKKRRDEESDKNGREKKLKSRRPKPW
jgi:hypothetical protein